MVKTVARKRSRLYTWISAGLLALALVAPVKSVAHADSLSPWNTQNPCDVISSPGFWKNYSNHYTDTQFTAFLQATTDFSSLTISQASDILKDGGSNAAHLLASELNVAANPDLGTSTFSQSSGGATVPASLVGETVTAALHALFVDLYPSGITSDKSSDYGATGTPNGDDGFALYVGDGSPSGENAAADSCDLTPAGSPPPPTSTPEAPSAILFGVGVAAVLAVVARRRSKV